MKTISIICNNDSVEFYHDNEAEATEWCYQMNEQGRDDALKQHGDAGHYRFYWHVHEAKPLSSVWKPTK